MYEKARRGESVDIETYRVVSLNGEERLKWRRICT